MLITPCSICQAALSAFGDQFHPFVQGTPWSTFLTQVREGGRTVGSGRVATIIE